MVGWMPIWSVMVERPGSRTVVVEVLDPDRSDCARSGWSAARISAVWCGRSVRLATRSGCARIGSVERG